MSRWFRFYSAAMRHPKVARLSDRDFRLWAQLLAIAAEHDGAIPCIDDLKHLLNARLDHLSSALDRLINGGLIDVLDGSYSPHNWKEKQYKSDSSTVRVQKFRSKGNVSETVNETAPETDTETDKRILTDPCPKPAKPARTRNSYAEGYEAFWAAYPTDPNMSKPKAYDVWKRMSAEDQQWALDAIKPFKAWIARQRDYRVLHAVRFLSDRRFEGHLPKADGRAAQLSDPRVDFNNGYSALLSNIVARYERGDPWPSQWRGKPGEPDCRIPREHWGKFQAKKALPEQQALFSEALH